MLDNALELQQYNIPPLFKYFLDGSRRTYKVDDVAYGNNIYPIVAGQIGVGCCKRENPDIFKKTMINMYNVIVMPKKANPDNHKTEDLYFNNLLFLNAPIRILPLSVIKFNGGDG